MDLDLFPARGRDPEIVDPVVADYAAFTAHGGQVFESYILDPPGRPLLRIPKTPHVVGAATRIGPATVLLLPGVDVDVFDDGEEASELLDLLVALVDACSATATVPRWTDTILLPGEATLLRDAERARSSIRRAERRLEAREGRLGDLRRRKLLVAGDGLPLEQMAAEAFAALGFSVAPGDPGGADLVLRLGRRVAVVESKGKAGSAAERDASQLMKWVHGYHADHDRRAKGILVVNGFRGRPLADRGAVFPHQMLRFVDRQGLCLLTGAQLLTLWLHAERDSRARPRLARLLMRTVGPLDGYEDPASA